MCPGHWIGHHCCHTFFNLLPDNSFYLMLSCSQYMGPGPPHKCQNVANQADHKLTTNTYAAAPNKLKPPRISRAAPNHRLSSKSGYGTNPRCHHTGCHQKPQAADAEAVLATSPFAAEQELNNCWSLFMCPAPDSKVHRTWPKWPKCAIYIIAIYYPASQQGPPESLRYRLAG